MVTWRITLLVLLCFSVLVSGFVITEFRNGSNANGGKVSTVVHPYTGAIVSPSPEDASGNGVPKDSVPENSVPEDTTREISQTADCADALLMVGPDHTLTADYVPPDLVYLSTYGVYARGAEDMLRREAAAQLGNLVSNAARDGVEVLVASGYRSYWEQSGTFEWFKDEYGEDAGKLSVPPGQSEHQLGTAVDFASSETNYELVPEFAQTSAGQWLDGNAARYGFVMSYREDREQETGVGYEPWHYRYIGVENALRTKADGGELTSLYREGPSLCYEP